MTERLRIQKFGPIQEAEIDVRDLTIFVGPQATGKSMAAQSLYFLSGMEETLLRPQSSAHSLPSTYWATYSETINDELTNLVDMAFAWWLGGNPSKYTSDKSIIAWEYPKEWKPETSSSNKSHSMYWEFGKLRLNDPLLSRVRGYFVGIDEMAPSLPFTQIYIPAGRSLYSYMPPAQALLAGRSQSWPGYILQFYSILEQSITNIAKTDKADFQSESLIAKTQARIKQVMKGDLRYEAFGNVALKIKGKTFNPQSFAAGQMEIWPFFATLLSQILSNKIEKTRFFIEEPEAHLHPGAQLKVLEIIASAVQQGAKVVITTHSPFILYAINNFITAAEVVASGQPLPPGISEDTALSHERVAAYRFTPRGAVRNIFDRKAGLIDSSELNALTEDLGTSFSEMQSLLLTSTLSK